MIRAGNWGSRAPDSLHGNSSQCRVPGSGPAFRVSPGHNYNSDNQDISPGHGPAPLNKTLAHNPTQKGVVPVNTFGRTQFFVAVLLISLAHRFALTSECGADDV